MTRVLELLIGETGYSGKVIRKPNRTGNLKASGGVRGRAARLATGSPEVVVKISSFGKGGAHAKTHLEYISRNAKLEMENERGELFKSKEDLKEIHKEWARDIELHRKSANTRDTMHVILSCPCDPPDVLKDATREFAKQTFGGNHQYLFVLHTDTAHPHVHLSVRTRGFDGRNLQVKRGDPQGWRETFAASLRERGVDAEATGRVIRGVVKRSEKQILRHIDAPNPEGRERVSRVRAARVQQTVDELRYEIQGFASTQAPWASSLRAQRQALRKEYLSSIRALRKLDWKLRDINNQILRNVRPDYDALGADQRNIQRNAAHLHQPGVGNAAQRQAPRSLASMRDMPGRYVDGARAGASLLLQPDARLHLDRRSKPAAHHEMRRTGTGSAANAAGGGGSVTLTNKELASQLWRFVKSMPKVETAMDGLKMKLKKLGTQFAVAEAVTRNGSLGSVQGKTSTPRSGHDLDRG